MKYVRAVILTGLIACLPLCVRAVPGDEHWDSRFNLPGATNVVFAIATNNGKVYTGGYLTTGGSTNDAIQIWDGAQWTALGFISGAGNPPVYDLAFMGNNLFVAGTFTNVNGTYMRGLVKWDGTSWSTLGLTGSVQSLSVDSGKLYAAGSFTNLDAGGVMMTNIGYWDGSSWHALGGGIGKPGSGGPDAVLAKNGIVYAGGLFTNSGSTYMTNIAMWNGSSWSQVGSGLGVANSTIVYCLALNGSDLYAGGVFVNAGATAATNIARWDGSNWNPLGNGLSGSGATVNNIGFLNGSVCVAGSFTASGSLHVTNFAVWNGAAWSAANAGLSAVSYRVLNNGTNVYVGGNFLTADNMVAGGIATWNGTSWGLLGTPGLMNGIATSPKALAGDGVNLYVGGGTTAFKYVGATNVNLIGRFDGNNWYPLGSGITGPSSSGGPISTGIQTMAMSNNVLYVGGYFNNAGGVGVQYIAQWDGTNWSALGNPGGSVASILVRTDGVYAVGAPFYNSTMFGSPYCVRWDGSSWQGFINYPPYTDTSFFFADATYGMAAIASIGTNIFIGGHFYIGQYADTNTFTGYVSCTNIMRFDGTYAWVMGYGVNNNVTAMATLGTNLFVAGSFTTAGSVAANKIAMWNGSTWSGMGGGVVGNGSINALQAIGNYLYVGGTFTNMGGVPVNRIAKWDGTNWYALGNGVTFPGSTGGSVSALGMSGSDLFVGGTFRMAGNKAAYDLSRWSETQNLNTPQILSLPAAGAPARVRLMGIPGVTNLIQASTNLVDWTAILTNSAGVYDFTDPAAGGYKYRFYRGALAQ